MSTRNLVRSSRRLEINHILCRICNFETLLEAIDKMPPHLRATCVLDVEEYLQTGCLELLAYNGWWNGFELSSLYDAFKKRVWL